MNPSISAAQWIGWEEKTVAEELEMLDATKLCLSQYKATHRFVI